MMSGFQVLPLVSQAPAHRLVSKVLVHSCATSLIGSSPNATLPKTFDFLHFPRDYFGVNFCCPKKILFTGYKWFFNMICCLEYVQNLENCFSSTPLLHECRSFRSKWPPYWEIVFLPCFFSVSRSHVLPRVFLLLFCFIISITIIMLFKLFSMCYFLS